MTIVAQVQDGDVYLAVVKTTRQGCRGCYYDTKRVICSSSAHGHLSCTFYSQTAVHFKPMSKQEAVAAKLTGELK